MKLKNTILLEEPETEIDETAVYREQKLDNCHISQRVLTVVFSFRQFIFVFAGNGAQYGCESFAENFSAIFLRYTLASSRYSFYTC